MSSINTVTLVGHLGNNADIRTMQNGQKSATLSLATDHSYKDKNSGEWVKRTEWHRIVTFQSGLIQVLEKHARKGRLTGVQGMLRTRKWTDQNKVERYTTEIVITPGGQIQFLEKLKDQQPNGTAAPGNEEPPMDDIPF